MTVRVDRYKSSNQWTLSKVYINDTFECYGVEDEYRENKILHETRIPEGTYKIELRTFGEHHEKYKKSFANIHKGMLWVKDVPKFKDILIHVGNTEKDTSGCLLVGSLADEINGVVLNSRIAYRKFYKKVLSAIEAGDKVTIIYNNVEPLNS